MARIKVFDKTLQKWVYADKLFDKMPQLYPEFANSIKDCTDQSKLYVLPDGFIYAYMYGGGYTNLVPTSIDTDGSVYNGVGYLDGHYITHAESCTTLIASTGYTATGFIPVTHTDIVRMSGVTWDTSTNNCIIAYYDKNKKPLGSYTARGYVQSAHAEYSSNGVEVRCLCDKEYQSVTVEDGVATFNMAFNNSDSTTGILRSGTHVKYMRITAKGSGADMIVTVNEEIAGNTIAGYDWRNTGHAFVPADYEERILALEKAQGTHSGVSEEITPSTMVSELTAMYEKGVRLVVINPKDNLVPFSIAQNGTVFNGCGYRKEYRLTDTGEVVALDDGILTGFIPFIYGETIQISGALHKGDDYGNYIAFYNSAFEPVYVKNVRSCANTSGGTEATDENNVKTYTIKTANLSDVESASYIRISLRPCIGRNMQVRYI